MKTAKHFALTILFILGATLCVNTPARADDWGTIDLVNTGAEPNATGQATLTRVKSVGGGIDWETATEWISFKGYLAVTCRGLTPGASYYVWGHHLTGTADRNGNLTVKGWINFGFSWYYDPFWGLWFGPNPAALGVGVSRVNPDLSMTGVLAGEFPYP